MPLYRRLPKRGFSNYHHRKDFEVVNLGRVQAALDSKRLDGSATITEKALADAGLVRGKADGVRVLADGELKSAITIEVTGVSKAAQAAIEAAGGKVTVTAKPEAPKPEKKAKKAKKASGDTPDDDNA
jgi:large subunit ribosomal protein L15